MNDEPRGFHLAACERSWKAGAPADEGCVPNCPRRLWADNEGLRAMMTALLEFVEAAPHQHRHIMESKPYRRAVEGLDLDSLTG